MQNNHYMQKDDGPIVKVNLNKWAHYRRQGYEFKTEAEFIGQTHDAAAQSVEREKVEPKEKKASKKKVMKKAK